MTTEKLGSAALIPTSYTPNPKERMIDNLPTYYREMAVLDDLYEAIAPEFQVLLEYLVTPNLIPQNKQPPPSISQEWQGSNEEIKAEIQHYQDNLIGWGFERLLNQFLLLGTNHKFDTWAQIFNTYFDQEDLIYTRRKFLFYSGITRILNGDRLQEELNLLRDNIILNLDIQYQNYHMEFKLSVSPNSEEFPLIERRIRQLIPAHYCYSINRETVFVLSGPHLYFGMTTHKRLPTLDLR